VTFSDPVPRGKRRFGGENCQSKFALQIAAKTVTNSGMVIIDSLYELSIALSNGTIADHIRLPLHPNNMFAAMPPSAK